MVANLWGNVMGHISHFSLMVDFSRPKCYTPALKFCLPKLPTVTVPSSVLPPSTLHQQCQSTLNAVLSVSLYKVTASFFLCECCIYFREWIILMSSFCCHIAAVLHLLLLCTVFITVPAFLKSLNAYLSWPCSIRHASESYAYFVHLTNARGKSVSATSSPSHINFRTVFSVLSSPRRSILRWNSKKLFSPVE